jgi:hypothetical protein
MKEKKHHLSSYILAAAIAVGTFAFANSAAALDRPLIYSPKDGNLLDQPLQIVGNVPVNTIVRITMNGRVLTRVKVPVPKVKKGKKAPTTANFNYTYKKTLATGNYTFTFQAIQGTTASDITTRTVTVPAKWRRKVDGMMVPTKVWNQLPFAVMVENTPPARPQAGLSQASIVYETLAEGGVTRFLAIFPQAIKPKLLGPVRSARPYYVDWAKEHDALYMHAGGSQDALKEIARLKMRSYDGLRSVMAKFYSRKCFGVHCLFTSAVQMDKLVKTKQLTTVNAKSSDGWTFKNDAPLKDRPKSASSKKLSIDFNGRTYRVDWTYDRASNRYKRMNGGVIAKDKNTGKQIRASNVLVMRIPKEKVLDKKLRLEFKLVGRGDATLYRDGKAISLRWWKKDKNSRTVYYLKGTSTQVEFNRGTTWVEVVPGTRSVTYK